MIIISVEPGGVPFESIDALVGAQLRMCRSWSGEISRRGILSAASRPAIIDGLRAHVPGTAAIRRRADRLVFDGAGIDRRSTAPPDLALRADAIALQYLARIERDKFQARVREVLMQRLQRAEPSQDEVAEHFA